jgi:hypothetical protein
MTMRALVGLGFSLLLVDCKVSQPGCTMENCKLMIEACRVEFSGSPAAVPECLWPGSGRPSGPIDFSRWCVDACNANKNGGTLASCIAGRADACRGARDAGMTFEQAIAPCLDSTSVSLPEKACDDKCRADQDACDTKCSGGRPCDNCLRAGMSCGDVCSDAGWEACLDCSSRCGVDYVGCSDRCPRAP